MKKSYIIGLIAIIAIGAGVYFVMDNRDSDYDSGSQTATTPTPAPAPSPAPSGSEEPGAPQEPAAIITYSDSGFSPAMVTVKQGETVRFVNNSNRDFWPASAIHPTHAVYPQKSASDCLGSSFDACKAIQPGGTWEFTFTQVGTWGYHDHLSASKTGKVTVTQ